MPALSCCIIAKNEADRLSGLLKGVSSVCEQVVVIDTGSTDNTSEIATGWGADVAFFPWNDSFADARNRSLEMARHPWIMFMDADDILPERSVRKLADLKMNSPEKAYGFILKSTQDGITGMVNSQIRMFPNHKHLKFRYRVHEQIRPALVENSIPIVFTDIQIIHTGYKSREAVVSKQERNIRLLVKDLVDYPEDGFLHYMAGKSWKDLGVMNKAEEEIRKAWKLCINDPERRHIALGSALELSEIALGEEGRKDTREALFWLERAEGVERGYPVCLYLKGRIAYETGKMEPAIESLTKLMACEPRELLLPVDMTMLKSQGAAYLAQAYMQMNNPAEAVAVLSRAQEILRKK